MPLVLTKIPGFADLPDHVLAAYQPALGVHLARVSNNAAFGMVRVEVFTGSYKDTDVVPLPTSDADKYAYSREECMYFWVPQNTANPATGAGSGGPPWSAWFGVWNVDQLTGTVSCTFGYRGNDDHPERQMSSHDSTLQVWTVAQRQKVGLILSGSSVYNDLEDADFYTDRALNESLAQTLNRNAKFAVVGTEVLYMGEFLNGDTVPAPISPADGYAYTRSSEVHYLCAWRWTADGTTAPIIPILEEGQLQDFEASVDSSSGVMTVRIGYGNSHGDTWYNKGRVAVFAFCARTATIGAEASTFAEIAQDVFQAGQTLHATVLKALMENAKEASLTPEFFYGEYANGATVTLPVSPVDGYTYSRAECQYIWTYKSTGPNSDRVDMLRGFIDQASGAVSIDVWRLLVDSGHLTLQHTGTLAVLVFAARQRQAAGIDQTPSHVEPRDVGTTGTPQPGGFYFNDGGIPTTHLVHLGWTASSDGTVTGYNVYRSTVSGGPYTRIASNVAALTYDDTTVVAGATYYYVTTAVSPSGESAYSSEVTEVIPWP